MKGETMLISFLGMEFNLPYLIIAANYAMMAVACLFIATAH